jgi:hypothetical protein
MGGGCIDPRFLALGTSWRWVVSFTLQPLYPSERDPGIHWIEGWVDPRVGLYDAEKRKYLTLLGLEFRPLGRPARSQSLSRLLKYSNKQWINKKTLLVRTPNRLNRGYVITTNFLRSNFNIIFLSTPRRFPVQYFICSCPACCMPGPFYHRSDIWWRVNTQIIKLLILQLYPPPLLSLS